MSGVFRILIIDTETNGLPTNRWASPSNYRVFPAILQISWRIYNVVQANEMICLTNRTYNVHLPDDIPWNKQSSEIHGISEVDARRGRSAQIVLLELAQHLRTVDVIIAHNLSFDDPIIRAAGYRVAAQIASSGATTRNRARIIKQLTHQWPNCNTLCTMNNMRDIMKLPASAKQLQYKSLGPYKSPSLGEMYEWLFGHPYRGIRHSASADVDCLSECISKIISRNLFQMYQPCKTGPYHTFT